jgi:L-asparaginase/Glu-tRNA(Gln) amidotransferase subunit D
VVPVGGGEAAQGGFVRKTHADPLRYAPLGDPLGRVDGGTWRKTGRWRDVPQAPGPFTGRVELLVARPGVAARAWCRMVERARPDALVLELYGSATASRGVVDVCAWATSRDVDVYAATVSGEVARVAGSGGPYSSTRALADAGVVLVDGLTVELVYALACGGHRFAR